MKAPSISLAVANLLMTRAPDEVIARNGSPFFQRWWLLRTPTGQEGAGNVYLHRFLRSDSEAPHDHPWMWRTEVLTGEYVEESWLSCQWLGAGGTVSTRRVGDWPAPRMPTEIHRIVSVEPGTVTLFSTSRKTRDWGFWVDGKFVPWRAYHGLPADWNRPAGAEQVAA